MIDSKLLIAILIGIGSIFCLLNLLRTRLPKYFSTEPDNLRKVISNQAGFELAEDSDSDVTSKTLLDSIEKADKNFANGKKVPLQRKFKYAQWNMATSLFIGFQVSISLLLFSLAALKFNLAVQLAALSCGPLIMHGLLARAIKARFKAFDRDYAQFLMQVVGLLKTGMTAMTAIQEAAKGLDPHSLVRSEVSLMVERVRFGIPEDRTIGAFAEDVDHPEIELFVQALLLSRRLGGNLSDTLERLSKQVRKRQYFRSTAEAAIGLQKGSLWIIIALLIAVEGYIGLMYPDLIMRAINLELGWHVFQVCFVLIGVGFVWIRQVTNIKI